MHARVFCAGVFGKNKGEKIMNEQIFTAGLGAFFIAVSLFVCAAAGAIGKPWIYSFGSLVAAVGAHMLYTAGSM